MRKAIVLAAVLALLGGVSAGPASSAPGPSDRGRAFEVSPVQPGRYAVKTPTSAEQFWVTAADGIKIFVEVWLPAPKGGAVPPARVPVVAVITPYAFKGIPRPDRLNTGKRWTQFFVSHGYAMANVHLRGTGESEGCWGSHDAVDADDASRAVELLTNASFSDGNVALFGKSHDGGAALNVAARGPKERLKGLKTIMVISPVTSYTDFAVFDGVPARYMEASLVAIDADSSYTGRSSGLTWTPNAVDLSEFVWSGNKGAAALIARGPCRAEQAAGMLATDGRVTPWMAERELASHVSKVTVPTLFTMGLREGQTRQLVGAFDGLRVPKVGLFSASGHDYPDQNRPNPSYSRGDWEAIVLAWLDRWLGGTGTGVDDWPVAQVQDTEGQWRAEPGFPRIGGPAAQLALGPAGTLGVADPTGVTSFNETTSGLNEVANSGVPGGDAITFETAPLKGDLEVVGEVYADLWVTVDRPAAHIGARLVAYRGGSLIASSEIGFARGARSVQFLQPLQGGRFVQTSPVDPPLNTPLRVRLRFEPIDVVVPAGGRLQLNFSGYSPFPGGTGLIGRAGYSPPAFSGATVTLLHDCQHTSMLRFLIPREKPDLLDVLEVGENAAELGTGAPAPTAGLRDGGGLASAPVCGNPVTRDAELHGLEIEYNPPEPE